jgi:gamma-glutamylaminecyclotransferase
MNEFIYWDDPGDSQDVVDNQKEKNNLVAVYGTLKIGKGNHGLLSNSIYMGTARTKDLMRLCVVSLPYLVRGESEEGKNVLVELYYVDDSTLASLDRLEGHPVYYKREKMKFTPEESIFSNEVEAWVYMVDERYDNKKYYDEF